MNSRPKRKIPLAAVILSAAVFSSASAEADTISLHCDNPNPTWTFLLTIDYAASSVQVSWDNPAAAGSTWGASSGPEGAESFPATISQGSVQWGSPPNAPNGTFWRQFTFNRYSGSLIYNYFPASNPNNGRGNILMQCAPATPKYFCNGPLLVKSL